MSDGAFFKGTGRTDKLSRHPKGRCAVYRQR